MKIKIMKINSDAIIPSYAHDGDAGMDLYSIDSCTIEPNKIKLVKTGIAIQLPKNTEAQIRPRSGLALKNGITVLNSPGTIDEGYRGEIGVILVNHSDSTFEIKAGMKVAQMVIKPILKVDVEEVSDLDASERGIGGFGSTGI